MKLSDIKSVLLVWSESSLINQELNQEDVDPINKYIDPVVFDNLIRRASAFVESGYDKTCLIVEFQDGTIYGKNGGCKFYLTPQKDSFLKLIEQV